MLLKGYEIVYPSYIFPSRSKQIFIWNIVCFVTILLDYIIIPFELCSMESETINNINKVIITINQTIYIVDIFIKFRKTYYNEKNDEIVEGGLIAKNYFHSLLFLLDVFALMPCFSLAEVFLTTKGYHHLILLLRLFKIYDIPRLYIDLYEYTYIPSVVNFIFYLIIFIFIIHIETCIWYALVMFEYSSFNNYYAEGEEKNAAKELLWLPPTYRNMETEASLHDLFY
jgi:hypothetical protein